MSCLLTFSSKFYPSLSVSFYLTYPSFHETFSIVTYRSEMLKENGQRTYGPHRENTTLFTTNGESTMYKYALLVKAMKHV